MTQYDITHSYDHPLFLDEIPTDSTNDALEAIKLIHSEGETPDTIAIHYNNLAKEYIKDKGKGYIENALSCYNKAIESNPSDPKTLSLLHSNRAHLFLLSRKNVQCVDDCRKAIGYDRDNAKAYYRGAKASLYLELYKQGLDFCKEYINIFKNITDPLFTAVYNKLTEGEKNFLSSRAKAEANVSTVHHLGYTLPEGVERVHYIKDGVTHFSAIFIYDEIGTTDYVIDMADTDTIKAHLDNMFDSHSSTNYNTDVAIYAEVPGNKLVWIDPYIPINKQIHSIDFLPLHILKNDNIEEKIQKLLEGYEIIKIDNVMN